MCLLLSHVWLCGPMDYSPPGSSVHWISQARILEWLAIPFFRESSPPRNRTCTPYVGRLSLNHWTVREVPLLYLFKVRIITVWASLVAHMVKSLPAMWETQVPSLGQEDPLEKGMATHSSILAWRIPWTKESGGLQSMGLQRVGHAWITKHTCAHRAFYRVHS